VARSFDAPPAGSAILCVGKCLGKLFFAFLTSFVLAWRWLGPPLSFTHVAHCSQPSLSSTACTALPFAVLSTELGQPYCSAAQARFPSPMATATCTAWRVMHAGVTGVDLMTDRTSGASRGFAFAEFHNHAAAEAARRILVGPPPFRLSGRELTVGGCGGGRMDVV
jgi:RNA recognition motif-containing protein